MTFSDLLQQNDIAFTYPDFILYICSALKENDLISLILLEIVSFNALSNQLIYNGLFESQSSDYTKAILIRITYILFFIRFIFNYYLEMFVSSGFFFFKDSYFNRLPTIKRLPVLSCKPLSVLDFISIYGLLCLLTNIQ